MAIAVQCKSCGCEFRAPDPSRGKTAPCPHCGNPTVADGREVPEFDVFVSHSSKDKHIADAVVAALEGAKIRCWVAPRDIVPGAHWSAAIIDAISNSRIMVLVYSGNSNVSEQVLREVERAVNKGVVIIPLIVDPTPMSKAMEYFISSSHWLDALTPPLEVHLERLVRTARGIIEQDDPKGIEKKRGEAANPASASPEVVRSLPAARRKNARIAMAFTAAAILAIAGGVAIAYRSSHNAATPTGHAGQPPPISASSIAPSDRIVANTLGMKFVYIPAGEFVMGSPESEVGRNPDETQHRVKISKPFYIGMHHVTRGQFSAFVDADRYVSTAERARVEHNWRKPGVEQGDNEPVLCVSWNDAMKFIDWLNTREQDQRRHYRLPTEAQWEYACRAGTSTRFNTGDTVDALGKTGWYFDNSGAGTHPVGSKYPNKWGLYDMHGNAHQWCSDMYGPYTGDAADPAGPGAGDDQGERVARGGSWLNPPEICRAANRAKHEADDWSNLIGFRCCLDFNKS